MCKFTAPNHAGFNEFSVTNKIFMSIISKYKSLSHKFNQVIEWLSVKGRIDRKTFWLYHFTPFVLLINIPTEITITLAIWILLAGFIKRFHDCNLSLKVFIPYSIVWFIFFIIAILVSILFLMATMTGNFTQDEFFEKVGLTLSLPFLIFLILIIYTGLKPSFPEVNKYGPVPIPSQNDLFANISFKLIKKIIGIGILLIMMVVGGKYGFDHLDELKENKQEQKENKSALVEAILEQKNLDEIRTLLEKGENPNKRIEDITPLMWGIDQYSNSTELVSLLIQYGADPNIPSNINGFETSALWLATDVGTREIIETLLKNGVDPTAYENESILIRTLHFNQIEFSKLLLDYGADLNSIYNDEALLTVTQRLSIEGVELLLANGISAQQIEEAKKWITTAITQFDPTSQEHENLIEIQGLLNAAKENVG